MNEIKAVIFDWGNTVMRDFKSAGPMKDWDHVEWMPGTEPALKKLSERYLLCIATSADHSGTSEMIAALKRVGAEQYFRFFFSSQELGFKKPDPRFFSSIVESLDIPPDRVVSVGDRYENDISPAKKSGLLTVWYNQNKLGGDFSEADAVIELMDDLPAIIAELNKKMDF